MKLTSTLRMLITEVAAVDTIVDAIKNRRKVIIYYDGDEPGGTGLREIEPVCLGFSKADNRVLRAWDMEGSSHTAYTGEQPLPGWRLFRLDKILSFKPTGEYFDSPQPNYNFDGDKSMTSVIINAVFDNVVSLNDIMTKSLREIVSTSLTEFFNERLRQYGLEYMKKTNASTSNDVYRKIQNEISRRLRRELTNSEINEIKPKLKSMVETLQNTIKNKY